MAAQTVMTPELIETILDRLPAESLLSILRDPGMPGYRTVMRWRRENAAFREAYAAAREDQGDYLADEIEDIKRCMRLPRDNPEHVAPDVGRVLIEASKWTAGRRKVKVYGDKLELAGDANSPLTIVVRKLTDAGG